MRKMIFLAMSVAALMICVPANAQSRKDKKAAKKAQWEMEQQQQREEAELRHQIRMDSIANAKKEADAKAARDAARQKRAEEAADLQEVEYNEPCADFESTAEQIRARGIGEDYEHQMSVEAARSAAIEELGSQIATKVQALVSNYKKSMRQNLNRESLRRLEGMTMTEVDQTTGYRIACKKTTTYIQNGERIFKTYVVVELGADQLLKPVYEDIQKDAELKIDADYQSFKKEFDQHFNNGNNTVEE